MKGVVSILAVFGIAAITTMIFSGTMFNVLFGTTYSYMEVLKEKHLISAINQLKFAKLAAVNALRYSLYQASFELASKGFCEEGLCYGGIYWRNYSEINKAPTLENVTALIGNETAEVFNEYANEIEESFGLLDGFELSLPEIDPNSNEFNVSYDNFIEVNVSTMKKVRKMVGIGEGSYVADSFTFSIVEFLPTTKLFESARKLFVERDLIGEAVNYAMENLPGNCKSYRKLFCENEEQECPTCEFVEVDRKCMEEFERSFENYVSKEVVKIDKGYSASLSFVPYYLIDAACAATECVESEDCGVEGCEQWKKVCDCLRWSAVGCECLEWEIVNDSCICKHPSPETCECLEWNLTEECVDWDYREGNYMECNYNWKVAVDAAVTIKVNGLRYPVYLNGVTELHELIIKIRVKSGDFEAEEHFKETGEIYVKNLIC